MELLQTREQKNISQQNVEILAKKMLSKSKENGVVFHQANGWVLFLAIMAILGFLILVLYFQLWELSSIGDILLFCGFFIFLFLASVLIFGIYSKQCNQKNRAQIAKFANLRNEIIINTFNQKYDDIKITGLLDPGKIAKEFVPQLENIRSNKWINGKQASSSFEQAYQGYVFKTARGTILKALPLKVSEEHYRIDGEGNSISYKEYYDYICFAIENFPSSWKAINFSVGPDVDVVGNLENEYFNQEWGYFCDDQVKLRRLLTPWVQEKLLEVKYKYTFSNLNRLMYWFGLDKEQVFIFETKIKKSLAKTVKGLAYDILNDLNNIEKLVQDLSVYKSIIR